MAEKPGAGPPVRVLRVIARLNVGGPALHVAYLTSGLAARGYDTTLVAGEVSGGERSMAHVARSLGADVVALPELRRELGPLSDLAALRRLRRLIRQERPAILHTHTAKAGALGRLAALLAGRARPRVIVHTFHGHVLRGYFGRATTLAFLLVERALARVTTVLVVVSPQVRDELVALGVAPASKFAVVRLGIDLDARTRAAPARARELRAELGIPAGAPVVGWVGRMTAIKRTDDLVRVLAALGDAHGLEPWLCLVGDGPTRAGSEALARQLGVAGRVVVTGYADDVAPYYRLFDAFLLTSANEGTPVVAIEALAAGVPVVAPAVGGVADVVRDGEDGLVVPPGDVPALADALAQLLSDPARARELGARGAAAARARYGVERLVDDVDWLYRSLLAASR